MLTIQEVADALPSTLKSSATQQFTDLINNIVADPMVAEQVRENFVSYTTVLKDGKFKVEDYLHAVTYVSFKLLGLSNQAAYEKTFPARMAALKARNASPKDISAFVHQYNKGKLVNKIQEQTMVPSWVLNQDVYQKAINTQADLMLNANSEKVRSDAANSILTHLKPPEAKEINLNIGVKENSGMLELKKALTDMAQTQKQLIESGVSTKDIAAQKIIEAEFVDVDPD